MGGVSMGGRVSVTSLGPARTDRPSVTSTTSAALAVYSNYGKYNKSNKHPAVKSTHVSKRNTKIETSPVETRKTETENTEPEIFGKHANQTKTEAEVATLGIAGNRVRAFSDISVVDRTVSQTLPE